MKTKRKPGRPILDPQRRRPRISVTLDPGTLARLDRIAGHNPRQRSRAIEDAVGLLALLQRATRRGPVTLALTSDGEARAQLGDVAGEGPGWEEALAGLLFHLGDGDMVVIGPRNKNC